MVARPIKNSLRAIRYLQWLTVIWMSVEMTVSLYAAGRAHSMALVGFGGDSAIELASAAIVLTRFGSGKRFITELQASKISAWLLFMLAFIAAA